MDYATFDTLGDKKSRNKIIAHLINGPKTFNELSEKTGLHRTSVFYHITQLQKEEKIIKRFVGKIAYIGMVLKERINQESNKVKK